MRDDFVNPQRMLDDDDGEDDPTNEAYPPIKASNAWRSIERLREMRELKKHLDDFFVDDASPEGEDMLY
jgi:hypothetical protein